MHIHIVNAPKHVPIALSKIFILVMYELHRKKSTYNMYARSAANSYNRIEGLRVCRCSELSLFYG